MESKREIEREKRKGISQILQSENFVVLGFNTINVIMMNGKESESMRKATKKKD